MRLLSTQERRAAPSPGAVQDWLKNAVTELFLNYVFRLEAGSEDSAIRDGFARCRNAVVDGLVEFEALTNPPKFEAPPEPDYAVDDILEARNQMLGKIKTGV
jgi:hypothetical protein